MIIVLQKNIKDASKRKKEDSDDDDDGDEEPICSDSKTKQNKEIFDHYSTPEKAIEPLINFLDLEKDTKIWDCACGNKNIIKYLQTRGYKNLAMSDIEGSKYGVKPFDFIHTDILTVKDQYDFIISHPPWSKNKEFLKIVIEKAIPFAFLLEMDVLGTKYLKKLMTYTGKLFYGVPIPKSSFIDITNKSIQVGNVFWFIGNYTPKSMQRFEDVHMVDNDQSCCIMTTGYKIGETIDEVSEKSENSDNDDWSA